MKRRDLELLGIAAGSVISLSAAGGFLLSGRNDLIIRAIFLLLLACGLMGVAFNLWAFRRDSRTVSLPV